MATPPPLRFSAQTPSTPLHGARYDQDRPRKNTRRISSRGQRAIETPPPNLGEYRQDIPSIDPTRSSTLRSAINTYSPPSSTHTSPRKKAPRGRKTSAVTRTLDGAGSSSEDPYINRVPKQGAHISSQQAPLSVAPIMLPTPAKTPVKKTVQAAAMNAVARQLFPSIPVRSDTLEDVMPTPRKRRNRRHVGLSLYSSREDADDGDSEDKIQIYTDSKDKVPELDTTENNPFYEKPEQHPPPPEPSKARSSKKRKAGPTAEDRKEIKDTFDRKEGMVYVFRGKKVYRKFPTADEADEEDDSELEANDCRPITRSSIKPRLLFPSAKQRQEREAVNIEDEEATTDYEEHQEDAMNKLDEMNVTTPVKQSAFAPETPPTTIHATRSSTKKAIDAIEPIPYKGKKVSPFDTWARTKSGSSVSSVGGKGKKREAEAAGAMDVPGSHKKFKSNSAN